MFATHAPEGENADVAVSGVHYLDRGHRYEMRVRSLTFYTSSYELRFADEDSGEGFAKVEVPDDAEIGTFADQLLITLRSPWLGHAAGTMLAAPVRSFMSATDDATRRDLLTALFTETETCSLEGTAATRNYLILSVLDNVRSEMRFWRY